MPYELSFVELATRGDGRARRLRDHRDPRAVIAAPRAFGYALVEQLRAPDISTRGWRRSWESAPGPDFGRLQRGETVNGVAPEQVMGATREGRKIVLSGDTHAV